METKSFPANNEQLYKQSRSESSTPYYFLDQDECRYMELIQGQAQPYFPEFAASVADQSPAEREWGRCAMADFTIDQCQVSHFADSSELNDVLAEESASNTNPPRRRLFILEDLPCNHILALGSKLRIPPSFFAGHWNDPASPTFNHRNPFQRCLRPHFRIRYATSNSVRVDDRMEPDTALMTLYAFNTNVCRFFHEFRPKGLTYDEVWSYHVLSFWSSEPREDGSWDAVLLVDPPPEKFVRSLRTSNLIPLRSREQPFLYPELDVVQELPKDATQWNKKSDKPTHKSMFEDVVQHYTISKGAYSSTHSPWLVVDYPRKLVLATLIAYIRGRYVVLMSCQKTQRIQKALRHNFLVNFSDSSFSSWSNEFFDFMFGSCAAMNEWARETEENMTALGVESPEYGVPQWEIDGWRSFRDMSHAVGAMTQAFANNYISYATISEAHTSNGSAKSLSKITLLTMLFIPLSTVASIFSMSEDFLPGKTRAWAFWAVSIPLLVTLAISYWRRGLIKVWCERRQIFALCSRRDGDLV